MTEEEKRALALQIMEQETARLRSYTHVLHDENNQRLNASLTRSAHERQVFSSLAQNGITWELLRDAYHTAFDAGHRAMLTFKLSFFYAGAAIAYHELYNAPPETTASFIEQLTDIAEEYPTRESICKSALEQTGVDTTIYDDTPQQGTGRSTLTRANATRKDRNAVERMKRTGITETDLEYERTIGYQNGWNTGAGMSVCHSAVALALYRRHSCSVAEIEQFSERVLELEDEEISAADIVERACQEAGVDVSKIAAGRKDL